MNLGPLALGLSVLLTDPVPVPTVLSVGDGDTLRVAYGSLELTIRLACIDAPETAQSPYGAAARQHLQQLTPVGAVVTLKPQMMDRYGRTVAELLEGILVPGKHNTLAIWCYSENLVLVDRSV